MKETNVSKQIKQCFRDYEINQRFQGNNPTFYDRQINQRFHDKKIDQRFHDRSIHQRFQANKQKFS